MAYWRHDAARTRFALGVCSADGGGASGIADQRLLGHGCPSRKTHEAKDRIVSSGGREIGPGRDSATVRQHVACTHATRGSIDGRPSASVRQHVACTHATRGSIGTAAAGARPRPQPLSAGARFNRVRLSAGARLQPLSAGARPGLHHHALSAGARFTREPLSAGARPGHAWPAGGVTSTAAGGTRHAARNRSTSANHACTSYRAGQSPLRAARNIPSA